MLQRSLLLAVALTLLASLLGGCTDPNAERLTPILGGRVTVTVTADAGEQVLVRHNLRLQEGMTALDALMQVADVRVNSQGTVQLVNGRGGGVIRDLGPAPEAWFYRVNGLEADIPGNRYRLRPGDSLWWDLRRWDAYPVVPVAVGGFPDMVFNGYRDIVRPPRIIWEGPFRPQADAYRQLLSQMSPEVRQLGQQPLLSRSRRREDNVANVAVEPSRTNIVIGRWEEIRFDPYIAELSFNPRAYGLTVWVEGGRIRRQDPSSEFSEPLAEADGFVWAATTDGKPDSSIILVISGLTEDGVNHAADAVREGRVLGFLAAALDAQGRVIP